MSYIYCCPWMLEGRISWSILSIDRERNSMEDRLFRSQSELL